MAKNLLNKFYKGWCCIASAATSALTPATMKGQPAGSEPGETAGTGRPGLLEIFASSFRTRPGRWASSAENGRRGVEA